MPEPVSGQPRIPARGDSEQRIKDRLARLEAQQEILARAVAELTARAEVPARHRARTTRRRGDTFLRVVKAAIIAVVSLAALVALMHPAGVTRARYSPRCSVACASPAAQHSRARADRG